MAIDGIGRSGGPTPPVPTSAAGSAGSDFKLESAQPSADTDLARLDRQEITREEYLQLRVDQATSHLEGRISPERLGEIKQQLLSQFEVDPVLQRLLQRATGAAASSASGDNG